MLNRCSSIISLIYSDGEDAWRLEKAVSTDFPPGRMIDSGTDINLSVLEKYVGDYLLDVNLVKPEKAARVSVAICGKQLCLTVADEYSVQVWPRSESLFFHQTSEFTIEFVRNDEGLVSGCIITLGGSRVNGIRATPSAEDESH